MSKETACIAIILALDDEDEKKSEKKDADERIVPKKEEVHA